ncbi:phBC6A51 family helix-turn-helix protein [Brevibacillus borstelensis]|uniref:phBC6A51 family helix-turn-helix protein n=1 Tax=Brevibacillus borstelensis TaxID=45462 RepID=UPI00287F853F|nr:phBC6A51 family helix-turn-helix protein [Brevibacillus borstelensis]WNF07466.1 phBC6A51 family helix-turn-helix protein [Brevibacillus borstelensis]
MALKRLETQHWTAIHYLALPKKGGKTNVEIAKICGVSEQTIYNWLKDPLFERELKAQMIRNSREKLPELIESLAEIAIRDGNAAMAKLALQINGLLTDKVEVETKVNPDTLDSDEIRARVEAYRARLKETETKAE